MGSISNTFNITPEFASQLREVELQDSRTDQEILQSLAQHVPVTTEKNIWAFWDKGVDRMPGWCQRNVIDWIRICSAGDKPWTVRVLDAIPESPNYALNFVHADMLPQAFVHGKMSGPYIGPHSADFLRGALLYQYGGVFSDVGNVLVRHLDRVCWDQLEDPSSPFQIAAPLLYGQVIANHFVMARKGDPFIKRWHDLFLHFWRDGRTTHKGIIQDPLLQFALSYDFSEAQASDFNWEFKIPPGEVFEYISQVLAWLRLTMVEGSSSDPFNGSEYWQKHVLLFDALQEDWAAEATVGFEGEDIYHALSTRLDADPNDEGYKKAHEMVWRILSKSTMQKVTHGKHLTVHKHLGTIWDENEGADVAPGTFAELLRYGCTHFEQTREVIVHVKAEKAKDTMKKGVFEA